MRWDSIKPLQSAKLVLLTWQMVHSIYPSASTGTERVCLELAGSFAIQEAEQVINCGGWRRLCLHLDKLDRKAGVGRGWECRKEEQALGIHSPSCPCCSTSTLHFPPVLKLLTSELTWLLALAKAGCIYCVVIFLTFCDFMLDTRGFF